ncbi:hypothetical protein M3Y97_00268200 [Aphelenchoides bicaudatus]|nr:hypothetical protein M3Y97_00268200 [Aphelenchoides bicaudatus]
MGNRDQDPRRSRSRSHSPYTDETSESEPQQQQRREFVDMGAPRRLRPQTPPRDSDWRPRRGPATFDDRHVTLRRHQRGNQGSFAEESRTGRSRRSERDDSDDDSMQD